MVKKVVKTNKLVLNYEYLSEAGSNVKGKQSFSLFSLESPIEDLYGIGTDIEKVLKAPLTSIEQNTISLLLEE